MKRSLPSLIKRPYLLSHPSLTMGLQPVPNSNSESRPEIIEIPIELAQFQLPQAVQARLQFLLDRQDEGYTLSQAERLEAEGLVELAEFLSLLQLRSTRVMKSP